MTLKPLSMVGSPSKTAQLLKLLATAPKPKPKK